MVSEISVPVTSQADNQQTPWIWLKINEFLIFFFALNYVTHELDKIIAHQ